MIEVSQRPYSLRLALATDLSHYNSSADKAQLELIKLALHSPKLAKDMPKIEDFLALRLKNVGFSVLKITKIIFSKKWPIGSYKILLLLL